MWQLSGDSRYTLPIDLCQVPYLELLVVDNRLSWKLTVEPKLLRRDNNEDKIGVGSEMGFELSKSLQSCDKLATEEQ